MVNSDPVAIEKWLKDRYKRRTDHAFAIVDLPDLPPDLFEQPSDCIVYAQHRLEEAYLQAT
ncbi:MAG: hypothetical protein ABSF63_11265 [Candidatus Bathyarchaeia archaeon]|jgi:hypothetical protein